MIASIDDVKSTQKGEFLIPNLNYSVEMPSLKRERFTTKALITNIINHNNYNIIDSIFKFNYNEKNDLELIHYLEENINKEINEYLINREDSLLKSIFNSIQIWGGNSARMFYFNNGFERNFDLNSYKAVVNCLRSGVENSYLGAIESFKKIRNINIAYASKHFSFWTADYKGFDHSNNIQLPILDRLINNLVYGVSNQPDYRHYKKYVNDMKKISSQINIDINSIERTLFNYADTDKGKEWIKKRLEK